MICRKSDEKQLARKEKSTRDLRASEKGYARSGVRCQYDPLSTLKGEGRYALPLSSKAARSRLETTLRWTASNLYEDSHYPDAPTLTRGRESGQAGCEKSHAEKSILKRKKRKEL